MRRATSRSSLVRYFGNVCGDGTVEGGEQCDDGNTADGDCCTSTCHTPDGISTLLLNANHPSRTRIALRARGSLLGLPALGSLDLPVRVQIQRTGEACWEATFDVPRVNTSETFKAVR